MLEWIALDDDAINTIKQVMNQFHNEDTVKQFSIDADAVNAEMKEADMAMRRLIDTYRIDMSEYRKIEGFEYLIKAG